MPDIAVAAGTGTRDGRTVDLNVDEGSQVAGTELSGARAVFHIPDAIYLGGVERTIEVPLTPEFRTVPLPSLIGCIEVARFNSRLLDFNPVSAARPAT